MMTSPSLSPDDLEAYCQELAGLPSGPFIKVMAELKRNGRALPLAVDLRRLVEAKAAPLREELAKIELILGAGSPPSMSATADRRITPDPRNAP